MRILSIFWKPLVILLLIIAALSTPYTGFAQLLPQLEVILLAIAVFLGVYQLLIDIVRSLAKRQFVLDYIALAAVITALLLQEWLVASIIALMLATGEDLEDFTTSKAERTLKQLISRVPHQVTEIFLDEHQNKLQRRIPLQVVVSDMYLLIKKGEIFPVDGVAQEIETHVDESSISGEPYPLIKQQGSLIRAGALNVGDSCVILTRGGFAQSNYAELIRLVEESQKNKPPLVRLAQQYSTGFTLLTAVVCLATYFFTGDIHRVLAVLVLATPCPLIIAAPIAFIGGVNAAAEKRIIIKNAASIEVLARVTDIVLDKTGTVTLGRPKLIKTEVLHTLLPPKVGLKIAASLEQYSLHPFAKALLEAQGSDTQLDIPENVHEEIGAGIEGQFGEARYRVQKTEHNRMAVDLCRVDENGKALPLLRFHFFDEIKSDSADVLKHLKAHSLDFHMLTGDKREAAEQISMELELPMHILAECTPKSKRAYIEELREDKRIIAMIGDGINDAPALAEADVSLAFSADEQTAATDAADIVLLGKGMELVSTTYHIAQKTVRVAKQAMYFGIGMSLVAMIFAAFGFIPPLVGSFLQEGIDIAVILYALRASTSRVLEVKNI